MGNIAQARRTPVLPPSTARLHPPQRCDGFTACFSHRHLEHIRLFQSPQDPAGAKMSLLHPRIPLTFICEISNVYQSCLLNGIIIRGFRPRWITKPFSHLPSRTISVIGWLLILTSGLQIPYSFAISRIVWKNLKPRSALFY